MSAIIRAFRIPLDVELSSTPLLDNECNRILFNYLLDVSTDSTFSLLILQALIEERRSVHRERYNKNQRQCCLKVGDVVKAHVQVQYQRECGTVGKFSYRDRGPFVITQDLGNNSFEVRRYDELSSTVRKYKNSELYLLLPALFPSIGTGYYRSTLS